MTGGLVDFVLRRFIAGQLQWSRFPFFSSRSLLFPRIAPLLFYVITPSSFRPFSRSRDLVMTPYLRLCLCIHTPAYDKTLESATDTEEERRDV